VKGLCLAGPLRSGETSRPESRDPVARGSSAGRMVARKARRSRGQEPMQGRSSQPKSSSGVCSGSPQNRPVTWLSHKIKNGGSAGGDGIRACREASKQRTHIGIARLASRLREGRSPGICSMVLQRHIPKVSLVGVYPSLGFRSILVFRLSPYILRGERMAAISRNPSSFGFPIFPSHFP
jgi:hypothetical protein